MSKYNKTIYSGMCQKAKKREREKERKREREKERKRERREERKNEERVINTS